MATLWCRLLLVDPYRHHDAAALSSLHTHRDDDFLVRLAVVGFPHFPRHRHIVAHIEPPADFAVEAEAFLLPSSVPEPLFFPLAFGEASAVNPKPLSWRLNGLSDKRGELTVSTASCVG